MKIATLQDPDTGSFTGLCECGFPTVGWPTEELAAERIGQHKNEHETGELMEDKMAFRERHGLVQSEVNPNLVVFPEGAKVIEDAPTKKGKK